jgi:hypothetical protein
MDSKVPRRERGLEKGSLLLGLEEYLGFCSTTRGQSTTRQRWEGPHMRGSPAPPALPTMMVPPVWVRRGLSTFLCTRKFGRKMTGGISVMVATTKDHCGKR